MTPDEFNAWVRLKVEAEIPCCENCPNFTSPQMGYWGCENSPDGEIRILSNEEILAHKTMGCISHPGARAYLNKSVIETLELELSDTEERFDDNYSRGIRATKKKMIALLKGDGK
jgi:hypothetical protein